MTDSLSIRKILCAALLSLSSVALAADPPVELKYLETLAGDETALVDAARRYQNQQFALMDWDQTLVEEYLSAGQRELAATQQESMQHRATTIRGMWEWVLGLYPKNARANNYYGEYLYDYAGDGAGGLRHWITAAQLDENLGAAQNNLGIYYMHTGDYQRGLSHLEKAVKLEPDNPDYLYNMVQMYLIHFVQIERITKTPRDKLYKQAMEMSKKAADLAPNDFDIVQDYAVNFFAGENFGVEVDWAIAAETWKKAQALARDENERYYSLLNEARAWISGKQPRNAIAPLEQAIAQRQDNSAAQKLLAQAREAL